MRANEVRPVVAFIPPSCCGAGHFRRVLRELGDLVDCRVVELPGHGRRYVEPFLVDAELAVRDVAERIGRPVDAVYGESLGAYLGLQVVATIDQAEPVLLFAASNSPPSTRVPVAFHDVSSIEAAVAEFGELGGQVSSEVLRDPVLAEHAFPLIRSDLYLSWSLLALVRDTVTAGDIQVVGGQGDTGLTGLESWQAHAKGRCEIVRLPGGHLLSLDNPAGVAGMILRVLAER